MPPAGRIGFLAVRMLGLVLVVPLFEELFWRSFVVRWIIDPDDFRKVPIGRVTPMAGAITAALFAVEHPAEWLPALLTGALWAWLLHRTKSVSACFVSHAVANLGLGIYVLSDRTMEVLVNERRINADEEHWRGEVEPRGEI